MSARRRFQFANLGITRGALIVLGLELGVSLVWLLADPTAKKMIETWLLATPSGVFDHGRVWTLVTSPLLEPDFLALVLQGFIMWTFVPTLERFWGTPRFYRFVAITTIASTAAGVGFGQLIGYQEAVNGLSPFTYAAIVAFGITYGRQPVQFFGVLPLTGRQLMYGFIVFLTVFVLATQAWVKGAAFATAMLAAAILTSKSWSPGLMWKRWKIRRARSKLAVMQGGKPPAKRDEKWLN